MKAKLTRKELEAVHLAIKAGLHQSEPENMADKLLYELVDNINYRIESKLRKAEQGNKTSGNISFNSIESRALHCWYLSVQNLVSRSFMYEDIVTTRLIHEIDRIYA